MNKVSAFFKSLVNMRDHVDVQAAAVNIRGNIFFRGPNVFILACAIIIASVGLNLNSIPVIIGAMLISPVMGPILGFGLGLGTNDTSLVKEAVKNFLVMVLISIISSTLFYLVSPLQLEHQTELLARTNPTLYDVFIALFGGFAGILENSRKEKGGTVIPGVAIATALMPPLCTVGYGIAHLEPRFIFGAFYLFIINTAFIALATFLTVKYLHFPLASGMDEHLRRRSARWSAVILLIIIVPSVLSAIEMIKDNNFALNAQRLVEQSKSLGKSYIYDYKTDIESNPPTLELYNDFLYSLAPVSLTAPPKPAISVSLKPFLILLGLDPCLLIGHICLGKPHLQIPTIFIVTIQFLKHSDGQSSCLFK